MIMNISKYEKRSTSLCLASWDGDLKLVKNSIEKGADIHFMEDRPLRWASNNGYLEIVKYLIEHGADVHASDDLSYRYASYNGHLEIVKYLVEKGADIRVRNDDALKYTFIRGNLDIMRYLKSVYIQKYKERFLCFNCLVLPCCTTLCSDKLVKSKR